MNFTELFAKLPTSTLQDWETAARKQLKGKPLESIDVSMQDGTFTSPYASGIQPSYLGGGSQNWTQFSSFSNNEDISGANLLEALNGGSQGLEISFHDLKRISAELSDVRFDFISLKVSDLGPLDLPALIEMIPEEQRSGTSILILLKEDSQVSDYELLIEVFGEVKFLLSPKLVVGDSGTLSTIFESARFVLSSLEDPADLSLYISKLGIEVDLSSDYLQNIVYVNAARLLFANLYHAFGASEPLPRPYLFGRIFPRIEEESHETYLIDATARAVAGISGGIDALTIEPYGDSDQFLASRRARNIQNVLAIEGLLGLPMNAVSGAAFFEAAAKELVSSVWPDY